MNHTKSSRPCRFGIKCRNATCRFEHSNDQQYATRNHRRGPCKFGERCTRSDCWFEHPLPNTLVPVVQKAGTLTTTTTTTTNPSPISVSTNITFTKPYQFCSRKECEERQTLGQVSIFEATMETALLPQRRRQLDPCLAVSRYRRSAAGTIHTMAHSKETLVLLLSHLLRIAATAQSQSMSMSSTSSSTCTVDPQPQWNGPWSEFLVDRLRACQADATRLFETTTTTTTLPLEWHVQMTRIAIWIRYWMPRPNALMESTLTTMIFTAMEHYWTTKTHVLHHDDADDDDDDENIRSSISLSWDDEMLYYAALLRLTKGDGRHTAGPLLLDYTQHVPPTSRREDYPLFHQALQLTTYLMREEYLFLFRMSLSILGKCCLAHTLTFWRYRQCQQYNQSWAKAEAVNDLDQLLHISPEEWSPNYAQRHFQLPCHTREDKYDNDNNDTANDSIRWHVIFKQVAMDMDPPALAQDSSDPSRELLWVMGSFCDRKERMGISSESIQNLLLHGRIQ